MKQQRSLLTKKSVHLTFVLVIVAMVAQPISEIISLFNTSDYELVISNFDQDSDLEEKQETEFEDENTELQIANSYVGCSRYYTYLTVSLNCTNFRDSFYRKINIPPPELG